MNALTMTAEATVISAVTRYDAPMPLSISRREPRRAPTTEITAAYAQTTKDVRSKKVPRLAISDPAGPGATLPAASYFDGHLAIMPFGFGWKPSLVIFPGRTTCASPLNVSGTDPL